MSTKGNKNKRIVWQDIVPAKQLVRTPPKKNRSRATILILSFFSLFKKTVYKLFKSKSRRLYIVVLVIAVIIVTLITIKLVMSTQPYAGTSTDSGIQSGTKSTDILVPGTPSYAILLPAGKTIESLGGGWIRDKSHPLFVYIDKIDSTQINVSEQPLTDDLKTDTEQQVESIAHSYKITGKITIGSDVIHIGTFEKGLQRIILSKSNLLILITSNGQLTNDQWVSYISSLQ